MKKILSINHKKGFTLIELLIVIAIIATLAVAIFVALRPAQRLADTRDARRVSDVNTLLTAIHSYIVDNGGSYPSGLGASTPVTQLGTAVGTCSGTVGACTIATPAQDDCLDLTTPLATYLKSIPFDPNGSATETQYAVEVDANGIVTVTACVTEGSPTVEASR